MQSLRQIKARIRSIENTKKLTRAMEMISISKIRRCNNLLDSAQAYFSRVGSLLGNILSVGSGAEHPFLQERRDKRNIGLCVMTSDTGLCGSYNHNVIRAAEAFLRQRAPSGVKIIALGRKGFTYFKKKGFPVAHSYVGFNGRYSQELCARLLGDLTEMFVSGQADEVQIAYTRPQTASRQEAAVEKFLNIDFPEGKKTEYIYEPDKGRILEELVPVYLSNKLAKIVLESFACEHQARALAMGEATKNATELLESLILSRNKIRQGNITREIMEVISSVEALKG